MSTWWRTDELRFAVGIENTFVPQRKFGERALDEYELTQHYEQWENDFQLIAASGASMVRWGIPWHRVNPEKGQWDWTWLDQVVARFDAIGVIPIIDLMHYGTPLWLEGQFLSPDYPARVAEYARQVAARYRDTLTVYTPMNEPMLNALYCGLYGYWPPYGFNDRDFIKVVRALQRGIVETQAAVSDELGDRASFVHVEASFRFLPEESDAAEEADFLRERAFLIQDLVTGRVTPGHPLQRYLEENGFSDEDFSWATGNTATPDVMGVNYYPAGQTELVSHREPHSGGPEDFRPRINAWTEGLADVLNSFAKRYGAPVFLTETGVAGTLKDRSRWLEDSVATVQSLRRNGLDVVGYTWWSLFDMIEWTYRHGNEPAESYQLAMGLWSLETDESGRMNRVRTPLADQFHDIATRRPDAAVPAHRPVLGEGL